MSIAIAAAGFAQDRNGLGPEGAAERPAKTGIAQIMGQPKCSDCGKGTWAPAKDFHSRDPLHTNEQLNTKLDAIKGSQRLLAAVLQYARRYHRRKSPPPPAETSKTQAERLAARANVPLELAAMVVTAAERARVPLKVFRGPSRKVALVQERGRVVLQARPRFHYWTIGRALNRDHSTVIHAEKRARQLG